MERLHSLFLSAGLIFGTYAAQAAPGGEPQDYSLRTKYTCQANGILVYNKAKRVSEGSQLEEVKFVAKPGHNQTLTFGEDREYMIWPRTAKGTFSKSLNVLSRDRSGTYRIIQEVDMGDTQITKTAISMSVKDSQGELRPVSCRIEMEWLSNKAK